MKLILLYDKSDNKWYIEVNDQIIPISKVQAKQIIKAGNLTALSSGYTSLTYYS